MAAIEHTKHDLQSHTHQCLGLCCCLPCLASPKPHRTYNSSNLPNLQFTKPTIHQTYNSSNLQFFKPTIHQTYNSSNLQFTKPTIMKKALEVQGFPGALAGPPLQGASRGPLCKGHFQALLRCDPARGARGQGSKGAFLCTGSKGANHISV